MIKLSKTIGKDDQELNHASQQITNILQKVKIKLMSRELEEQKEAVAWLINELNTNTNDIRDILVLTLLKSEIIALLCETITTMQGNLVTSTLRCLNSLITSEEFYRQNHASYVTASILRAGHFLTFEYNVDKDQLIIVESIAYTIEKIFEGSTSFRISPNEVCDLIQILEFFKKLLTAESQTYRIVFSIAKVLSFVLRYTNMQETENEGLVFVVVETTLKFMRKILESKNPNHGKYAFRAMVMTCAVCADAIFLCSRSKESDIDEINSLKSSAIEYRVNLANCIYSAMMKAVIPNFNKIEQDERNGRFYIWFVTSLNGLYDVDYCNSKNLSNHLAEQGFLQILPSLTILPIKNLRDETFFLLSKILTTLASVSLSVETWLGGAKQFQKFLLNAFKSLPIDISTWVNFLKEGDARSDALIVLFYYNFLRESMSNAALYLPSIIAYSLSSANQKTKRKSITIQKAFWLIFSIAAVSHEDPSAIDSYEMAMTRLFTDLESLDIENCYTHHPAVVVLCLKSTSIVSDEFRAKVVCLWLENDGDLECIVDSTSKGDLTNYYCLVEMVKTGTPKTVDVAMKAISELVKNPETIEGLGNIAWEILQQILTPGYQQNYYNTMSVLKFAGLFEPNQISGSLIVRLLYLLRSFILENESDLNLVLLGIKNAYCLLSLSIRRNDIQGVTMFTNEPKLIKLLKNLAFSETDYELSYICFNCLSTLIRLQANYSIQCENTLEIESQELLQQLYLEQCFGALKLATAIFTSEIDKPALIVLKNLFTGSHYDVVIRSIYLQLHVIYFKSEPEGRNLCYALLVGILNHCRKINNLEILKNLCEMDWTYVLIDVTINANQNVDSDFMVFVSEWLSHRYFLSPLSTHRNDETFGRDQFEITLDLLGKAALSMFREKPEQEALREFVQSLMLFREYFSGDIGTDLEQADKQFNKN